MQTPVVVKPAGQYDRQAETALHHHQDRLLRVGDLTINARETRRGRAGLAGQQEGKLDADCKPSDDRNKEEL